MEKNKQNFNDWLKIILNKLKIFLFELWEIIYDTICCIKIKIYFTKCLKKKRLNESYSFQNVKYKT